MITRSAFHRCARRHPGGVLSVACLTFIVLAPVAQAQSYTLTDLGTLGGTSSLGTSVNNSGQVAGYSDPGTGHDSAFLSGPNGGPLKSLGTYSDGEGVNASGQVTGGNAVRHAFLSSPNGGPLQDLGTLPGGTNSVGYAVNDSGQVGGRSDYAGSVSNATHAFLSGPNGGPLQDLGTLPGGTNSLGLGVNASGQVAGRSDYTSSGPNGYHAFLSGANGGPLKDLGTLGGPLSEAYAVNASGQVTGNADIGGNTHAFLSGANGGPLKDLGTLPSQTGSIGFGVNASGQVVGSSGFFAFIYSNGVMTDLNTLIVPSSGIRLQEATSISDTGFITAYGFNKYGRDEAFLLTPTAPVPEASSAASLGLLLALGLGGLIAARRKRAV